MGGQQSRGPCRHWRALAVSIGLAVTTGAAPAPERPAIDYWIHATVPTLDGVAPIGDLPPGSMARISDDQEAELLYHQPGTGVMFARTSWDRDASWIAFVAGTYDASQALQRPRREQGSFTFFKNEWLSVTSNLWSKSGVYREGDVNVIRFERPDGSVIPQDAGDTVASNLAPSSAGGITTAMADLTSAYSASGDSVHGWTRTLELSGDTLRVTDTCSIADGVRPVFQLHVPEAPAVQADGSIQAGRLRVVLKQPATAAFVAMDPAEYARGYRIDLRSSAGCSFAVELQARPSPRAAPRPIAASAPEAVRSPGHGLSGQAAVEAGRPTADEVRAELAGSLLAPERLTLVEHREEGVPPKKDVIVWERYFDGIEVLGRPLSVRLGPGRWETRTVAELAEPEPMRAAEVISAEAACRAAEADPAKVKTRLVYWPVRGYRELVSPVQNAADVEKVIHRYHLAIEVDDPVEGKLTWVDAYTGGVLDTASLSKNAVEQVTGRLYGLVTLDVTPVPSRPSLLKDPVRFSQLTAAGTPFNGQGVVTHFAPLQPLTYWDTATVVGHPLVDAAFALEQSWDLFNLAFGRTGLRNVPRGPFALANDAVLRLDDTRSDFNAFMRPDWGLISVNSGHPDYRLLMNLEVIGHEWTHAVFAADVNNDATAEEDAQQGGLNEGTSDFFAILIGERGRAVLAAEHACQLNPSQCGVVIPPLVPIPSTSGAWLYSDEGPMPGYFPRDLCRPSRSAQARPPRDYWGPDFLTQLGRHVTMGPLNRAQCLLSRGMLPVNATGGDPDLKDVRVPNGFPGLGSNAVARMWYRALAFMHQRPAPVWYADARDSMLEAAAVVHGRYSDEYKAVEDAFAAVNVGFAADRTGPQVSLADPLVRSGGPIVVNATDPSGVESIRVYLDGSPGTGTELGSFTAPPGGVLVPPFLLTMPAGTSDGPHSLHVIAKDTHRNESTTSLPVTVDNIPPTVSVVDQSTLFSAVRSPMRVFDFTARDDRSLKTARILVNGADPAFPSSGNLGLGGPSVLYLGGPTSVQRRAEWVNLGGAGPGIHIVSVEVSDVAGNTAIAHLPAWARDVTPPSLCTLSMTRGSPWSSVTLAASARDAESSISKVKYLIDGITVRTEPGGTTPPGTTFSKTITATLSAAGSHTFTAECIDQQGNRATSTATTDAFGPPPSCFVAASVLGPSHATNWAKVVMVATASSPAAPGSTLSLIEVRYDADGSLVNAQTGLNRGPGVVYTGSFTTASLSAGTHSFRARCRDSLNQSTTSNTVMLSLQPPGPPPPVDVVFTEVEPNNVSQQSNLVSTTYNVVRGAISSTVENDWFAVVPPTGKQVCVAGAVTNGSACTNSLDLFYFVQGVRYQVIAHNLFASRSQITSAAYVCAAPGSDGFVYVLTGAAPSFCPNIAYDILVKFQ
jgi:hypothetical protein